MKGINSARDIILPGEIIEVRYAPFNARNHDIRVFFLTICTYHRNESLSENYESDNRDTHDLQLIVRGISETYSDNPVAHGKSCVQNKPQKFCNTPEQLSDIPWDSDRQFEGDYNYHKRKNDGDKNRRTKSFTFPFNRQTSDGTDYAVFGSFSSNSPGRNQIK
ncbi:hypothetical protein AYI68_g657 [Smittium mucronatum]|uniref:Uncharacterized protein n=1 Tax=Smittium mucronatum TaxID=133383 RepID=A0A1R0H7N5_9FUNG|nr:hypothetical protein AYI68_g657 [Smittium mucronatum]